MKNDIAVVTVTYNAAHNCDFFLPSLEHNIDVIGAVFFVDNNSHDATLQHLKAFQEHHQDVVVDITINTTNKGYAAAINIGIQKARNAGYTRILVTNNDVIFHDGCLAQLMADMNVSRADVVGTPASVSQTDLGLGYIMDTTTHLPGHSPMVKRTELMRIAAQSPLPHVHFVHGGTILFSSSFFKHIGMYDDALFFGGDELDFLYRVTQYNKQHTLPVTCVVSLRACAKMDNLTKHNNGHKIIKAKRILQGTVRVYLKHRYTPRSWGLYREVYRTIRNLGKRSIIRYIVLGAFALRALTLEVLRYYTR